MLNGCHFLMGSEKLLNLKNSVQDFNYFLYFYSLIHLNRPSLFHDVVFYKSIFCCTVQKILTSRGGSAIGWTMRIFNIVFHFKCLT